MQPQQEKKASWLERTIPLSFTINWETLIFSLILVLGIISRFYDLESRVMSHDETSHVYYSWRLFRGLGFQHNPLTHGTLHFILTAFSYFLFGDNDFTARVPFALFSVATIGFVWFFRRYLGRIGALITAGLMLISPFMLYYGRYVRNESLVAFFGIVALWAILRYLETGEVKYTYWLTAVTMLHFTAKETAFIYTAQALVFLGIFFIIKSIKRPWKFSRFRTPFLISLIVAFVLLIITVGLKNVTNGIAVGVNGESTASGLSTLLVNLPILLSGGSLVLALYFAIAGLTWKQLRKDRILGLIILLLTLVLPHLAPFPMRLVGWNPTDYSMQGISRSSIFVVPLALVSIVIGVLWNRRLWLTNAAIFYVPFTILYTTFFTNGVGFFTGLIGSLGYWLEQQAVGRGSQPWYYYLLLEIPFYEFLTGLGVLLTLGIVVLRKLKTKSFKNISSPEHSLDSDLQTAYLPKGGNLFLWLTGYWVFSSLIAYTIAGEKMPWLTVHIALPMILFSGWGLGQLVESIHWSHFRSRRGGVLVVTVLVILISLASAISVLFGSEPLTWGSDLGQLNNILSLLFSLLVFIVSSWLVIILAKKWTINQIGRLCLLIFFVSVSILTARTAFRAAYIKYDYPTEFLVYAHGGPGIKEALDQIEELSLRITDGLGIQVAFDDETTYPYWWYLRNYTNQNFFGANPTREVREAPVILVGDNNFPKIEPVVGQAYYQFDYIRIWWPNQDYYNLTWERLRNALTNPEMRKALWQIWLNRDYSKYADLTGNTGLTLSNWQPSDRMRLYVRKDIVSQVWNRGVNPTASEAILADPYEGKGIEFSADLTLTLGDQLNLPRNLTVAPDGTLYIADTGNHRIVHVSPSGNLLHTWGSFGDSSLSEEGAPAGTFYEPWGIAIAPEGNVYVADTWNHRIQKFTPDGQFLMQWGYFGQAENASAFWGPRDIAVDDSGRVYVTDTGNKRIVIFGPDGNFITEFGSTGLIAGQFDEPVSLAVDNEGLVYVADTWNQRVQVFSPDQQGVVYTPVREWSIDGWYGQSMDNKPYIRVTQNGEVFVSDPEGYRILEFNNQGDFIRYWGSYGTTMDAFNLPTGMAFDPTGVLWVADSGNNRILHFTLAERYQKP